MAQLLLIPDPRPLDERLGEDFFRTVPQRPGVYLMRDAAEKVLYVGKAKSLRQRLGHYRIANPDRMPRRHLRLLRQVVRIELQFCADEATALEKESELLLLLKPPFNRAGVWAAQTKFLTWRVVDGDLQLAMTEVPEPSWKSAGPMGGGSRYLHQALYRLLWLAVNESHGYAEIPAGWAKGRVGQSVAIQIGKSSAPIVELIEGYFSGLPENLLSWMETRFAARTNAFDRAVIELEMETLKHFSLKRKTILGSEVIDGI